MVQAADFTLPITGGSVAAAVSIVIWWFAKERIIEARKKREAIENTLSAHIKLCTEKHIDHVRLEDKVARIDEKLDDMKETMVSRMAKINSMDDKIDRLITNMATGHKGDFQ